MGERKYFVRYATGKYDGDSHEEFIDITQVEAMLTEHAENPDFTFDVIYGERIEFEPAKVVKAYRAKRS